MNATFFKPNAKGSNFVAIEIYTVTWPRGRVRIMGKGGGRGGGFQDEDILNGHGVAL